MGTNKLLGANDLAPKRCRCGKKLERPKCTFTVGNPENRERGLEGTEHHKLFVLMSPTCWNIECKCGSILLWRHPSVWKQSHILEIGRTMEIVVDRDGQIFGGYA